MRKPKLVLSWLACLVLSGAGTVSDARDAGTVPSEPLAIVLLPSKVTVLQLGWTAKPSEEWIKAATTAFDSAMRSVVDQSSRFTVFEMPELSPEERVAIDEFVALTMLVQVEVHGKGGSIVSKELRARIDRTLGPSLAFIAHRTGAVYALGGVACQTEQSKGRALAGAVGTATLFTYQPFLMINPVSGTFATLFLVDLRTGELRWLNGRSGYEVAGYNFTDLRDTESAQKSIGELLEAYPEVPSLRDARNVPTVATGELAARSSSSRPGEFVFRPPAGSRVKILDDNVVTVTRNGRLLDEIKVEIRRHGNAFPKTGQTSTRDSTPDELARWYVQELQQQGLSDLRISETSVNEQLAGREAFMVRFSHALPIASGGVRVEQMALGAAVPHGLLLSSLSAPQLNYFAKALPAFEASMRTMELVR